MNISQLKKLVPQSIRNYYHLGQAILANLIFGFPSRHIKIIGVTGTNGKTTTCQMIAKVLEEARHPVKPDGHGAIKVAMASTINFKIGGKVWVNATKFTTLSSFAVQKFIRQAVKAGCEYLILETSSHSLDQNRAWGIEYYVGVITNITREHLDYHKTMDEYRKAKMKLFKKVRVAIINLDLKNSEEFLNENMDRAYGYSVEGKNKDIKIMRLIAENIKLDSFGSKFEVNEEKFKLNIPGKFNIENALVAICIGIAEGIKMQTISEALEKIKLIPGRMERVSNNKGLNIIIDYAVTPDSLEKLYELVKNIQSLAAQPPSKIIAVFGACGERDRGKRPMMGEIVSRSADYIILTNEDPYDEDPWQIINEVAAGIENKKENINLWKIMDRREAIRFALKLAKPGDYVIITGKGAEETMAIGKERIQWNDKKVILEELDKIKKS